MEFLVPVNLEKLPKNKNLEILLTLSVHEKLINAYIHIRKY